MRKITIAAKAAFDSSSRFDKSNTKVYNSKSKIVKLSNNEEVVLTDCTVLKLYDTEIAIRSREGLYLTTNGYNTRTTIERLKSAGVKIGYRKGTVNIYGEDGTIIKENWSGFFYTKVYGI